ncbi:site-specific DNA-methyltransferase [Sinimarinibacterium sp. CAU 1509]|uniref:site-specific DNA-methyltransferase n=1 Tax=Sinimarinibacterium sp. CAU 1509 TaxID=2562283 RepID=UPI001B7F8552|nr:site-specific DNA-methyltransferase [Sinimarinibacterium sp. CAU 1509]
MQQASIFRAVHAAYAAAGEREVSNDALYDAVGAMIGTTPSQFRERSPIGRGGAKHGRLTRTARWVQQTMRARGWLERAPDKRGVWRLTSTGRAKLHAPRDGQVLIGFSTRLGVALVGNCRDAFHSFGEPIHLILTSPPYPLAHQRNYGNVPEAEYVDFLCACFEPVVRWLAPGGSVVLSIGQDIFVSGSPARSLFIERLTLALHDRLGLHLMDRAIWDVPNKPPGPVQWASIKRMQLNVGYEFCLVFCNEPALSFADNRRVLLPHTDQHRKLIARGGEQRTARYSDGAYTIREGSYSRATAGRIPRNVMHLPHNCASQRAYKKASKALGLPAHGAPFPVALADFWIRFLTEPDHLTVDPMSGSNTVGVAAEALGQRWASTELFAEHVRGAATRFPDAWINPLLDALAHPQEASQSRLFV